MTFDQFGKQTLVAHEQAVTLLQDLPEQGFACRAQVDQIDGPSDQEAELVEISTCLRRSTGVRRDHTVAARGVITVSRSTAITLQGSPGI